MSGEPPSTLGLKLIIAAMLFTATSQVFLMLDGARDAVHWVILLFAAAIALGSVVGIVRLRRNADKDARK